jgi:hypothetical protein
MNRNVLVSELSFPSFLHSVVKLYNKHNGNMYNVSYTGVDRYGTVNVLQSVVNRK